MLSHNGRHLTELEDTACMHGPCTSNATASKRKCGGQGLSQLFSGMMHFNVGNANVRVIRNELAIATS